MGVTGLAPFIQKICPEVVKTFPDRLRALAGKTIVIDGTLITQRLHFAPMPHRYRHVLGWFRIMKELRECDVRAICVFDGKERSLAKELELERRRTVRRITAIRGALESERLQRLQKVTTLLCVLRTLKGPEREFISDILRHFVGFHGKSANDTVEISERISSDLLERFRAGNSNEPARTPLSREIPGDLQDIDDDRLLQIYAAASDIVLSSIAKDPPGPSSQIDEFIAGHEEVNEDEDEDREEDADADENVDQNVDEGDVAVAEWEDGHPHIRNTPISNPSPNTTSAIQEPPVLIDRSVTESVQSPQSHNHTDPSNGVISALALLYLDYRRGLPELINPPEPTPPDSTNTQIASTAVPPEVAQFVPGTVITDAEQQAEHAMSKTQHQLTVDEGTFWSSLSQSTLSDEGAQSAELVAAALAQKSSILSESYKRRTNPPTSETYMQCKEILRAMGVPCIESTGAFEAEALAASLVVNGHADYVASEDTDVLIYEAPLVRNIANRNGPLVVISGTDLRHTLELDRASYVDFALLLGTDFSQRIKYVGPARALKFIRAYGSIERILECESQYQPRGPPERYLAQVGLARTVFSTLPPMPDAELLQPMNYDDSNVMAILERYNLQRAAADDWDPSAPLSGNFFEDDPSAE